MNCIYCKSRKHSYVTNGVPHCSHVLCMEMAKHHVIAGRK